MRKKVKIFTCEALFFFLQRQNHCLEINNDELRNVISMFLAKKHNRKNW